jgi:hypothetical protein
VSAADPIAAGDNDPRLSDARTPTDGSVTAAKVSGTLKPSGSAAAGDEALRALGTTASTAAAGNHNHSGVYDPAGTAASAVSAHEADTSNVHGIADTSKVVILAEAAPDASDDEKALVYDHAVPGYVLKTPASGGSAPPYDSLVPPVICNSVEAAGTGALAADSLRVGRYTLRKSGTLVGALIPVQASGGNLILAAYDTGQASATVRTKLGDNGAGVATPAAVGWGYVAFSSGIAVTVGQHIDVGILVSTSVTLGRRQIGAAGLEWMPAGIPGDPLGSAVLPKLAWAKSQTFGSGAPATVAEADAATTTLLPLVVLVVT